MELYDWLLFLHVAAAFILVAAVVLLGVVLLGARGDGAGALLGLSPLGLLLWDIGGLTVIVFGIWLALNVDGYELWDAWIVVAIVLWFVAAAAGGALRREFAEAAGPPPRAYGAARPDVGRHRAAAARHGLQARRVMLAALRPDDWNLPLLVHVAGAMLLVGFLVAAAAGFARAANGGGTGDAAGACPRRLPHAAARRAARLHRHARGRRVARLDRGRHRPDVARTSATWSPTRRSSSCSPPPSWPSARRAVRGPAAPRAALRSRSRCC